MATKTSSEREAKPHRVEVPQPDSVEGRILAVYRVVRVPGAVFAGIGNLILTFAFDWRFGWLAVAAAGVALLDGIRELRSPRSNPAGVILVDATLLGLTMVAIGLPAVSFAFGLWIVLLTAVLASGWWRPFLYAYVALWAVLANLVTWSGAREWTPLEVLVLDWTALILVGALVVALFEVALGRIHEMEAERTYMLGVVGHELGNALTSVSAIASTLERHGGALEADETTRLIASVRSQAQESADIADDLISMARLRQDSLSFEPELVDAWEETAGVIERVVETMGHEVTGGPWVEAPIVVDPLRFRQVIRNLLINAIRYGESPISAQVIVEDGEVVVSVTDGGPGVTSDEAEAMFEPFRRARSTHDQPGAGLGLWISHRLAAAMGGKVRYDRVEGLTVFEARFPLALGG